MKQQLPFICSSLKGHEETQVMAHAVLVEEKWNVGGLGIKKRRDARLITA